MKQTRNERDRTDEQEARLALCQAFLAMETTEECLALLEDLCTPAELEALADRWRVVPLLMAGKTYRAIHDETGVSVTTIGRIARFLEYGNGGYQLAHERLNQ